MSPSAVQYLLQRRDKAGNRWTGQLRTRLNAKPLGVRAKGFAILDVPQEQLDKWRTLFGRVYVGAWEVIEARSRGNETKATWSIWLQRP